MVVLTHSSLDLKCAETSIFKLLLQPPCNLEL